MSPAAATFAELVAEVRRRRGGVDFAVLRRVDSTSLLAARIRRELAADDVAIPHAALVALEQSGGRGRLGRPWVSAPGLGIYATVVGRLADPEALPALPLAIAVALADVLDRHLPVPCRLKWPNDLMCCGRKLGGVLVEAALRPGRAPDVIVGFGINHGHDRTELPTPAATSLLLEAGGTPLPSLPSLACDLVEAVLRELRSSRPLTATVGRWLGRSQHAVGDLLHCRLADRELDGRFLGLTSQGLLRLDVDGREEVLVNAEVSEL